MKHIEDQLQASCIKWFDLQYSKISKLLFAVPNGGKRNAIEAKRLKTLGVRSGVADLILMIPNKGYGALCLEMKVEKGRQSDPQHEFELLAVTYGNKYVICRSFDDFKTEIENYLSNLKF